FAVGNVNIAILRIDENAGGHKENRGFGIERLSFDGAVGRIHCALLADLEQHFAAVMRVFLDHSRGRTRNPDVVVLIRTARMQPRVEKLRIAPGVDDRKSTRLNSSHVSISYAVFCLKKKKRLQTT